MGSKSFKRLAVPLAALTLAVVPATAGALPDKDYSMNGATGDYAPAAVHKNYALNGATGDYAPAINVPKATVPVTPVPNSRGFAWGDAAVGAATALLIALLASLTLVRIRRRRISAPSPARPSAA
jgi:hypothetical protein